MKLSMTNLHSLRHIEGGNILPAKMFYLLMNINARYIFTAFIFLLMVSCSKLDNYAAPNAALTGAVLDAATKQPVQTEQPNGIMISLFDEGYPTPIPINFWTRPDGSFENANIFSGKYKVIASQGAFFPTDTVEVTIGGSSSVNFTVIPYLSVTATAMPVTGGVILQYQISRTQVGDKIMQSKALASAYPSVSNIVNEVSVTHDLSGWQDPDVLSFQFSDTLTGLISGNTYYTRVAALTNNAFNKYNYSPVMTVSIP